MPEFTLLIMKAMRAQGVIIVAVEGISNRREAVSSELRTERQFFSAASFAASFSESFFTFGSASGFASVGLRVGRSRLGRA